MTSLASDSATPELPFDALLSAARGGDPNALDQLFARVYPRVERIVHAELNGNVRSGRPWLNARLSTGDVVQEVFRDLCANFSTFAGETEESLVGYLALSVRHRLIDLIRFHEAARRDGRRSGSPPVGFEATAKTASPLSDLISEEEVGAFQAALGTFPERERFLLRSRLEAGVQYQALADQLGYTTKSAARRAFHTAQATLIVRIRQNLAAEEEQN